jgi:predicted DNA binding CopG/RHH family protein
MKKTSSRKKSPVTPRISAEEALRFLEEMRLMSSNIDEPTVAISLRVPGNVLRSIKLKAKADGRKYQSLMIEYLRKGLSD